MDFLAPKWESLAMLIRSILSLTFVAVLSAGGFSPAANAVSTDGRIAGIAGDEKCLTVESIARTNRGIVKEEFRLSNQEARMFLAADPALLDFPEDFDRLMRVPIDEIVVWRHRRMKTVGMAVPFSAGCAAQGYGEPDLFEKLVAMRKLALLMSSRGPDNPEVRSGLRDLATFRERTATGQVISTPSEVEARVETLLARIQQAQARLDVSATDEVQGTLRGCTFSDLNVSVEVPEGFLRTGTDCPMVGYRGSIKEMQALGFYVVETPVTFSLAYNEVEEFVDGQVLVTQVQFDKAYGSRLLDSRQINNNANYPEAIINRNGACGQLEVAFPRIVSGREGVERRRGLICAAELPPGGANRWTIINVFVFETSVDPSRIKPTPEFEQIFSEVSRSVRFNQPDS